MSLYKFLLSLLTLIIKLALIESKECKNISEIGINFIPKTSELIPEKENRTVIINIYSDCLPFGEYKLSLIPNNDHIFELNRKTFLISNDGIQMGTNLSFTINAKLLGRASIEWVLNLINEDRIIQNGIYYCSVFHDDNTQRIVFTIIISVLIMVNNINMGCQLNLDVIQKVMRKPISPLIGFLSQFLFMPIGSYFYGILFFNEIPSWRFGLLTLGCSPGGTVSNLWTLLFNGDIDLSITMTLISTIAALGMMPFWMYILGHNIELRENTKINIPFANLAFSLIGMTIPLGIGLIIQKYKPLWAERSRQIIRPFTIILLIMAVGGGLYINFHLLKLFTWSILGAGMSVAWSGYIFGALAAYLFKLSLPQIIAVSIETALQNPGIAFVLLQLSLPQPESDLAAIPIIGQLLMTGPPLWIIYLFYIIIKKFKNKHKIINQSQKPNSKKENDSFI